MDPTDIAIMFIIVGVLLELAEIFMPGFFIAVPGTASIIYGFLILLFPWILEVWWGPWILALLTIPITGFSILIYRSLAPPSKPVTMSYKGLVGAIGIVVSEVKPDTMEGQVRINSDIWSATTREPEPIPVGAKVKVVDVEGVHLIVERID